MTDKNERTHQLRDFYDRCQNFDWYFEMSDDGRVFREGACEELRLRREAVADPAKLEIWNAWKNHMYTGKPWGTEKAPKPERP